MKGDMHVHSNISDGSYDIEEILIKAKEKNIEIIGLTNHDTIQGLDEAISIGKKYGIKVIKGVEMSAYDFKRNRKAHILGYNIGEGSNIELLSQKTRAKRHENSLWQLEKIINMGFNIDYKKVIQKSKVGGVLYKQHIMEELIHLGYTDKIYGELYMKLFKNDGPCNREIEYVSAIEAVKAIKKDGGIAVMAHPGQLCSYELIEELILEGLDGIERNHPSHSLKDKEMVDNLAKKNNLIKTGGSDYHGCYGDEKLGSEECPKEFIKIFE